ncbi:DELTA-sagatoxin-Srs1a-like isoform X2 [Alosa alosa]|uniref:DELTA-sagatoxin-Srs1a-like isoform X2 n=1 Tax=Alosa alosa TaxID=278164 RepID=UPI0020150865|nr:DELTA-sagatoxin-Srs1a-like isoform X2 [Alosa alosa]
MNLPEKAIMPETAEAVAATITTRRNVTVEITNLTNNYCLLNPKVFLESGETYNPPQPTVRPLKTEVCTFSKTSAKATGSVGVMTYDLFERTRKGATETLAIMFSVPWDYNVYKNWYAIGIYPVGKECDEALYKGMYYDKEPKGFVRMEADGSGLTFEGSSMDVKATMCPMGRAIMKVELWDKLFSPGMQQSAH